MIYYTPLVEIKDFNALIDNKPFFGKPVSDKQEAYEKRIKSVSAWQAMMIIQHETYSIVCTITNIINILV